MMLQGAIVLGEVLGLGEQILKAQQRADALVEGVLVGNHAFVADLTGENAWILSHLA